jgi:hypothetical protein
MGCMTEATGVYFPISLPLKRSNRYSERKGSAEKLHLPSSMAAAT